MKRFLLVRVLYQIPKRLRTGAYATRHWFYCLSWGLLLLALAAPGLGFEAVILPRHVRVALESNADSLSPLTVTWERRHRALLPPNELRDRFAVAPVSHVSFRVHYLWQSEMLYWLVAHATMDWNGREQILNASELSFNGETVFAGSGMSRDRPAPVSTPALVITPTETWIEGKEDYYLLLPEYLHEAGFRMPRQYRDLGRTAASLVLHLVEEAGSVRSVEFRPVNQTECCVVTLETSERMYTFYLDPSLGYAVRWREERTPSGALALRAENEDFVGFPDQALWLPRRCRIYHYSWGETPVRFDDEPVILVEIEAAELHKQPIPQERFTLFYDEPGAWILDHSLPDPVHYEIPADLAELDRAIAAAREASAFSPTRRTHRLRVAVLVVSGVVLVVLGALFYRRSYT